MNTSISIELHPPLSVGPLQIGDTRDGVATTMRQFGEPRSFTRARDRPGWMVDGPGGLTLFVYFGDDDLVEAIEAGRPTEPTAAESTIFDPAVTVSYNGYDVFGITVEDLIAKLRLKTTVDEEDGCSYIARDLLLAFWRPFPSEHPDDEQGRYFESVLVARPGYYDRS